MKNKLIVFLIVALCASLLLPAGLPSAPQVAQAAGDTYYVSPSGNDNNPGTSASPWKTLTKAGNAAQAGDTVIFKDGSYPGVLRPANSGTSANPITFRAQNRRDAKLIGNAGDSYHHAIDIEGKDWIRVEGFHIQPQNPEFGRWINITSSNGSSSGNRSAHVTISDVLMQDAFGLGGGGTGIPLVIEYTDYMTLKDSTIREFSGGDMAHVLHSKRLLIEGNAIGEAGHSPMAFSPLSNFGSNQFVIVRGNVFFAGQGRPFEFFGDKDVVFEDNLVTNGYHGRMSAGPDAKLMLNGGIVRYNRFVRNWGSPVNIEYYNPGANAQNVRIYNNVFDDNYQQALRISNVVSDYIFKNNVFSRNDRYGDDRMLIFKGDNSVFRFYRNLFYAPSGATAILEDQNNGSNTGRTVNYVENNYSGQWVNSLTQAPGFKDPGRYNHTPSSGSVLIDNGSPLTATTSSGSGTVVPVGNAQYFFNGFGIEDGDIINIGSSSQQRRITAVDYANNTLTLASSATWSDGDPVSLNYEGSSPDLGAYEEGANGRITVEVDANPFEVVAGQAVTLTAAVHGTNIAATYSWDLGNSSRATGSSITRTYNNPGLYPLIVRATVNGIDYLGTGMVEVKPSSSTAPLVETNFNGSYDPEDYYHWNFGRSANGDAHTFENGYVKVYAESGGQDLPAELHARNWNLNEYSTIYFKYKIKPGTPIGLYLQGFRGIGEADDDRRVWVALTDDASVPSGDRVGAAVLADDDAWHTVSINAAKIREKYPDIDVIETWGFLSPNPGNIQSGDYYMLDWTKIIP